MLFDIKDKTSHIFLQSSRFNMDNALPSKKQKLEGVTTIKEGKAEILVEDNRIFYNPVQEFNRDLSITVLSQFAKDIKKDPFIKKTKRQLDIEKSNEEDGIVVLEALSATGLRSIRFAKEVPGIKKIIANDIELNAVNGIKRNVSHNGVEDLVMPNHADAILFMHQNKGVRFDAIDIDPYGCSAKFLDSAVQAIADGGLLLVTSTDMAALSGNTPESCLAKYGSIPLKSPACHEIALRILLQCIATQAARYGRYIVPVLSVSIDFYIRVFVKVYTSPVKCKENSTKMGVIYQCAGCESINLQPFCIKKNDTVFSLPQVPCTDQLCKHCHHKQHMGGPIWLGPLHDKDFISQLLCNLQTADLGTIKRLTGVLNVVYEELDVPLYYVFDRLMSIVRVTTPPILTFRSALLNAGYEVSYSHAHKTSIKTNAPNEVIWDIVRAWEKKSPCKREKHQKNSPGLNILDSPSTIQVSLEDHPAANPASRQKGFARYQINPLPCWGPATRSKTITDLGKDHSEYIQMKRSKKEKKDSTETITEIDSNGS